VVAPGRVTCPNHSPCVSSQAQLKASLAKRHKCHQQLLVLSATSDSWALCLPPKQQSPCVLPTLFFSIGLTNTQQAIYLPTGPLYMSPVTIKSLIECITELSNSNELQASLNRNQALLLVNHGCAHGSPMLLSYAFDFIVFFFLKKCCSCLLDWLNM